MSIVETTPRTMKGFCSCEHKDQDRLHGEHIRVFNRTKQGKPERERQWRCFACGRIHS